MDLARAIPVHVQQLGCDLSSITVQEKYTTDKQRFDLCHLLGSTMNGIDDQLFVDVKSFGDGS